MWLDPSWWRLNYLLKTKLNISSQNTWESWLHINAPYTLSSWVGNMVLIISAYSSCGYCLKKAVTITQCIYLEKMADNHNCLLLLPSSRASFGMILLFLEAFLLTKATQAPLSTRKCYEFLCLWDRKRSWMISLPGCRPSFCLLGPNSTKL